jgi:hypothetical protein
LKAEGDAPAKDKMIKTLIPSLDVADATLAAEWQFTMCIMKLKEAGKIEASKQPFDFYFNAIASYAPEATVREQASAVFAKAKEKATSDAVTQLSQAPPLPEPNSAGPAPAVTSTGGQPPVPATDVTLVNETTIVNALAAAASNNETARASAFRILDNTSNAKIEMALQSAPTAIGATVRPRVYLHVPTKAAETKVKDWRESPEIPKGFVFPGVQVVGPKISPRNTEVRYFDPSPRTETTARQIAAALSSLGVTQVTLDLQRPTSADLKMSRDIGSHFEVWFGSNELK